MCKKKIEDLVFAKTSQGIYCIGCHNDRMARSRNKGKRAPDAKDIRKEKSLPSIPAQLKIPLMSEMEPDGVVWSQINKFPAKLSR